MHILRPRLNSDVFQVACPFFFYKPLVVSNLQLDSTIQPPKVATSGSVIS